MELMDSILQELLYSQGSDQWSVSDEDLGHFTFWYQVSLSSISIISAVIVFLLIIKNGSYKFLFQTVGMILLNQILNIAASVTNYFNTAENTSNDKVLYVIFFYIWIFIVTAAQYTTLNLILWRVSFKYWETSR